MKKYIYSIVAATALFASCSQDAELNEIGNTEPNTITTIGASTEISTRAVVSSSDNTKVLWQDGDQIGVLGTNELSVASHHAYTLVGDGGSTSGTFKDESSDITAISAIMYPYQTTASWDCTNSKLTCEIPSVQKATKGSFDKAAAVMYSIGNTTNVKLNYAVNFLKVAVSETNVHAISISSTTTALSGKMEITSEGVSAATSGSQRYVTLTAGDGNVLETGAYYIAVKAGDIENPTISYVYLDQTNHTATEKSKAGNGTLTFTGGINVKPISVTDWDGATERKAVQLYDGGPYFAEYNVGASSATETGTTMTFTDATKAGADYVWGANWCTPSKEGEDDGMNELLLAAQGNSGSKVTCNYCEYNWGDNNWGFKFTSKGDYTDKSVFFPARDGVSDVCIAYYWSGTASGSGAWYVSLYYGGGGWYSNWLTSDQDNDYLLVRPVLKN